MADQPTWRIVAVALLLALTAGAGAGAVAAGRSRAPEVVVTSATVPPAAAVEAVETTVARSVPDIAAGIAPSVVAVRATVPAGDEYPGTLTVDAAGTGFVIRSDGVIATAAHVVRGAWKLSVTFSDGEEVAATVLGVDDRTDLALLRVERRDLVPVVFGRTADVRVGEPVIALGHAHALGAAPTVSVGVLSAVERTIAGLDGVAFDHLLQTDAAINTGSSGGPLVNSRGEVIGVNTAKITTGDAEGLGFAICTDHALPVLERLQRG